MEQIVLAHNILCHRGSPNQVIGRPSDLTDALPGTWVGTEFTVLPARDGGDIHTEELSELGLGHPQEEPGAARKVWGGGVGHVRAYHSVRGAPAQVCDRLKSWLR